MNVLLGGFMEYALPRASDLPDIASEFVEVPTPDVVWRTLRAA